MLSFRSTLHGESKTMLLLTRKPGQRITIQPAPGLPLTTPVGVLFAAGPLEIVVQRVHGQQVRIGIQADAGLLVLREELDVNESLPTSSPATG